MAAKQPSRCHPVDIQQLHHDAQVCLKAQGRNEPGRFRGIAQLRRAWR
jgi:hypothetical protein